VKIKWPSGPALVALLFLVLLPALAVLQYRWVGQVSEAERERMQRNLENAADQFDRTFETEIVRALVSLQAGAQTARDGASDQYSRGYTSWLAQAEYPNIVAGILLVDVDGGKLRLRRWNAESHLFEPSLWPPSLAKWRPHFEYALAEFRKNNLPEVGHLFTGEESLVAMPIRQGGNRPPVPAAAPQEPVFGFTILELDMPYLRNQMIPRLVERHFVLVGGDSYRVAVTAGDQPACF
jgi:hypothetical protein